MDDDQRLVAESGADDFLAKPCHEDELLEKIRRILNVVYHYEESAEGQAGLGALARKVGELGPLPPLLVEELRKAIFAGNRPLLQGLIGKVRESADAGTAERLQSLADRYDYDALTSLLAETGQR